ncbi:MAG TPA: outer membrane protein assembly factor BamD [Candidatus Deferrimicrobiaceae bacterium]|nr:outer membrane protein assembly factor BamD [Candidatus Deferrimicrobiaceae bacterium]
MLRLRHLPAVGFLLLVFLVPACSKKLAKQPGLPAPDLFAKGEQKFAAKKYKEAVEAFQLLLERFPNSPLAPRAQLGLADARMNNKDNAEAEVAFDDFLRLYPADDNVSYACYRKGELLARQTLDPGRDQSKTLEAIKSFTKAKEKDPNGPYAAKASARIAELRNRLAEHEKRVVAHYFGRKHYASAEARARRALSEYPESAAVPSLLTLLAESLEKQGKMGEAAEVRKGLEEKFPAQKGKKP